MLTEASDWECTQLSSYCKQGWPQKESLPVSIAQFRAHRAELTISDCLLLRRICLLVSASLRKHTLSLIHNGHLGVNRRCTIARGLSGGRPWGVQIKTMVENCPNSTTRWVH
ncbi:hypothetical protein MTO96_036117 [Rhipicephalus appendiculatus]